MKDEKKGAGGSGQPAQGAASIPNRILGSLRDALNAASRDDRSGEITVGERADVAAKAAAAEPAKAAPSTPAATPRTAAAAVRPETPTVPAAQQMSAADALREAKTPTRTHFEAEPTTRVGAWNAGSDGQACCSSDRCRQDPGDPRQAEERQRRVPSGPGGGLAGGRRRSGTGRLPAHLRRQQRHRPQQEPAHPDRLRRRYDLVGGAGLHPLQFDGPLVPVRAKPVQDQHRRGQRQEADRRGQAGGRWT